MFSAHLGLLDFGVCVQELLDLRRVNVLSSSDDQVFDPALDLTVAECIQAADISAGNVQTSKLDDIIVI